MSAVALASVKHSPGVTTTALALATAAGAEAVVVEADPAGGDIAARAGLALEPGLLTLAAAARHAGTRISVDAHLQHVACGAAVLVAPSSPELASGALRTIGSRLASVVEGRIGFIDLGRVTDGVSALERIPGADLVLLVAEPTVAGVEHLRVRLADDRNAHSTPTAVLLVGERPYRSADVEEALGIPVVGALAVDPRGVAALYEDRGARRALLVRSARSVLDRVRSLAAPLEVTA